MERKDGADLLLNLAEFSFPSWRPLAAAKDKRQLQTLVVKFRIAPEILRVIWQV